MPIKDRRLSSNKANTRIRELEYDSRWVLIGELVATSLLSGSIRALTEDAGSLTM